MALPDITTNAKYGLTNVKAFEWAGLKLMGQLEEWSDNVEQSGAVHRFLKVDGAQVEDMGSPPREFRGTLCFMSAHGHDWAEDYTGLLAKIAESRTGLLVHPMLGQFQAFCHGVSGAKVHPGHELNTIIVPIRFTENNLDVTIVQVAAASVATKKSAVDIAALDLASTILIYSLQVAALAQQLVTNIALWANDCQLSSNGKTNDPSLGPRLDAISVGCSNLVGSIRVDPVSLAAGGVVASAGGVATPTGATDAMAYAGVSAVEILLGACMDLLDSVGQDEPSVIQWTVPGTMSIAQVASVLYGAGASSRVDEILQRNPAILNPAVILGGTVLTVAAPTV